MPKGGLRPRAADGSLDHLLKPKWKSGKTRTIRVPVALAEQLVAIAHHLDEGKPLSELTRDNKIKQKAITLLDDMQQQLAAKDQVLEEQHKQIAELLLLLGEIKQERHELDQEVNELHEKNGDLNLELEKALMQIQDWEVHAKSWQNAENYYVEQIEKLHSQLAAKEPEVVEAVSKPDIDLSQDNQSTKKIALSQSALARRLGCSHTAVAKQRKHGDFSAWSGSRDPEGIHWEYNQKSRFYHPCD